MINLNKEAEVYVNKIDRSEDGLVEQCFIAGTNSKSVEQRVIQAQIKILEQHIEHPNKPGYKRSDVLNSIKQLKQELQDE